MYLGSGRRPALLGCGVASLTLALTGCVAAEDTGPADAPATDVTPSVSADETPGVAPLAPTATSGVPGDDQSSDAVNESGPETGQPDARNQPDQPAPAPAGPTASADQFTSTPQVPAVPAEPGDSETMASLEAPELCRYSDANGEVYLPCDSPECAKADCEHPDGRPDDEAPSDAGSTTDTTSPPADESPDNNSPAADESPESSAPPVDGSESGSAAPYGSESPTFDGDASTPSADSSLNPTQSGGSS